MELIIKKRKLIAILGTSAVVAAASGYTGFALTRTPKKALQPWKDAGNTSKITLSDIRKYALSYAILAPNPHKRQPWQVTLDEELGMMPREQIADPEPISFKQGLERYRELLFATPAYSWIVTEGNNRYHQIEAGWVYLHSNLKAMQLGFAIHPISQCLQEYPEVQKQFTQLHKIVNVSAPDRIQMFSRIRYGPEVGPSPQ